MTKMVLSIASIVLSVLAFGFSIYTHFSNKKQTERINNINIKTRYFEVIFDKYLISTIPEKRSLIRFNESGKLVDFQPLIDELSEMRRSAFYFKYDNKDFFDDLKEAIREIEDYLSTEGNRVHDNDEQAEVTLKIAEKISNLYACINRYYLGL